MGLKRYIEQECDALKAFLVEKNEAYGNSVAEPVQIFSRVSQLEQIDVRIDDKLSRLMRGKEYAGDDTEKDLLGYLLLKRAVKRYLVEENQHPRHSDCRP